MLLLSACASQRPKDASNYEAELRFANEAYPFVFLEKKIFDDPLAGVMLRYADMKNPGDLITVYVYPIPSISWDDKSSALSEEMDSVLGEVDYMVRLGHYKSRGEEVRSDFEVSAGGADFSGKKAQFYFADGNGITYDSYAYLFISKDKFVKFRTSFNAKDTPDWSGDEIVGTLLPTIEVPGESPYMSSMRENHRQQMATQFMNLIMEAAKKDESNGSN